MAILDVLKRLADEDPEIIDGARLDETVQHVMLEVEHTPVLPHRCADYDREPPSPAKAQILESGKYWVDGVPGEVSADALKWMRCRYLLVRGLIYKRMRSYPHSVRQRLLGEYFGGSVWLPPEGSELDKAIRDEKGGGR